MKKLKDDFVEQVLTLTGQSHPPRLFIMQPASHRQFSSDHFPVALAQWELARDDPDVKLAGPLYPIVHQPDGVHLTADSSILVGKYFAEAIYETVFQDDPNFKVLAPESVDWTDKSH